MADLTNPTYQPSGYHQWCPPEITQAAVPLRAVSRIMKAICDDHQALSQLTDSSPTRIVPDAVHAFVNAWTLVLFSLQDLTDSLADSLHWAAEDYVGLEQATSNALLKAWHQLD
jgi:hypothetical protein